MKIKKKSEKIKKDCVVCGKTINVFVYENGTYRGGHFFGDIPLPKGKTAEYWECPKCYWNKSV